MNNSPTNNYRNAPYLALFIVTAWAMTISLLMRRRTGKEYIGITGLVGLILILFYSAFANAPQIVLLAPLFFMSVVFHRIGQFARRARGEREHTFYNGDPWLTRVLFFCKDNDKCKRVGEPLLAFLIGAALLPYGDSVGGYFFIGGISMIITQFTVDQQVQQRLDDMHNGMIENENLMQRFHEQSQRRRW